MSLSSVLGLLTQILLVLRYQEGDVGRIQRCVDRYVQFYHGGDDSQSILKPVDIVAKAIISSPLHIEEDDLLWQMHGEVRHWLSLVRSRQGRERALFYGTDIEARETPAVREFVVCFYDEIFINYCQGERGILRGYLNLFREGCEAYYIYLRSIRHIWPHTYGASDEQIA
jgi:CRISPR type I-D-associated protein Csc3/Cas10d